MARFLLLENYFLVNAALMLIKRNKHGIKNLDLILSIQILIKTDIKFKIDIFVLYIIRFKLPE